MKKFILPGMLPVWLIGFVLPVSGQVALDSLFRDHMVLQRNAPIVIWGNTVSAEKNIQVRFAGKKVDARIQGTAWEAVIPALPAGGPYTLTIEGSTRINRNDILVGDVWICAGQSNMRFRVSQGTDAAMTLLQASSPMLRLSDWEGTLNPINQAYPLSFLQGLRPDNFYTHTEWRPADSNSVRSFSAVGYYFGSQLQRVLQVPIGLVGNAIGGVPLEAYLPSEQMQADSLLHTLSGPHWLEDSVYPRWTAERVMQNLVSWKQAGSPNPMPAHPYQPGFLFDAAIRPLHKLAFTGVIWYQGESNATYTAESSSMSPVLNKYKLTTLINSWRNFFRNPDLHFVIIQLPSIQRDWELYREVQLQVAQALPHVSLVVTTDLGHNTDVHPRNKKPVGERAASTVLAERYGYPTPASPLPGAYTKEGNSILIRFTNSTKGLTTSDGAAVRNIFICGADRVFYPATVQFIRQGIKVSAALVTDPVSVRYAFEDNPAGANLVNEAGFPVSPFRLDQW